MIRLSVLLQLKLLEMTSLIVKEGCRLGRERNILIADFQRSRKGYMA